MGEPNWRTFQKKRQIEEFFKNAFCAESAEMAISSELPEMKVEGIIKIVTGDKRGTIYLGRLIPKEK